MIDWKYIEDVSLMIERHILGRLSSEEVSKLDKWRHSSKANEETYCRLINEAFLRLEFRRREMINSDRAKNDMLFRIGRLNAKQRRRTVLKTSVIASVSIAAILVLAFFVFPIHQGESFKSVSILAQATPIMAGTTKATLTLSNNSHVVLGGNTTQNIVAIKNARQKEDVVPHSNNILSTPRGGEFKITLEDGTVVWLNAESQLYYPETFDDNERRVKLVGEAYFEVSKNAKKPFYVETDKQVVRVYGTQFNICAYANDPFVYTTLVTGSISLQPNTKAHAELILTPGHQVMLNKITTEVDVKPVNTEVITSWRNGRFVFDDQNLEQIMKILSRWYDISYEFKDNSLKNTVFMGGISRYSNFNSVLETLEKSGSNLKFVISNRHVIISKNK